MVVVAALGLLVNIVAFSLLQGADRDNLNIRGAAVHVLGDLLGSVAALIAGARDPADRLDADRPAAVDPGRRHHRAERLAGGGRCRAHSARRRARGARYAGDRARPRRQCQGRRGGAPRACLVDHPEPAHGDAACLRRRQVGFRPTGQSHQGAAQGALRPRPCHRRNRARRMRRRSSRRSARRDHERGQRHPAHRGRRFVGRFPLGRRRHPRRSQRVVRHRQGRDGGAGGRVRARARR